MIIVTEEDWIYLHKYHNITKEIVQDLKLYADYDYIENEISQLLFLRERKLKILKLKEKLNEHLAN